MLDAVARFWNGKERECISSRWLTLQLPRRRAGAQTYKICRTTSSYSRPMQMRIIAINNFSELINAAAAAADGTMGFGGWLVERITGRVIDDVPL